MPEPDQDETTDETLEIGDMPAYADQTPAETGVAEEGDEGEREDTPHAAVGAVSDGESPEVESEGIGSREEADESEVASEEASEAPVATTLAAIGTATMASSRPPLKMEKTRRALAKMIAPPQVPRDARGRPLSEKQIVDGLDRRERVFSIGAGLLALALGIVLAILYIHTRSEPLKKGQVRLTTGAAVALILVIVLPAIAMLIGVAAKRRAAVGFCALMLGFALSSIGLGIIPLVLYWGLAAWLLTRAYRLAQERRGMTGASQPRTLRERREAQMASAGTRATARDASARRGRAQPAAEAVKVAPKESKRYTPPRKPAPKPGQKPGPKTTGKPTAKNSENGSGR